MPIERSQKREAMVGMVALAVLIVSFLLIFFLADLRRLFTPTDELFILMPSAAGLTKGAPVWIAGQPVGEVADIEVRPPGSDSLERVAVRVKVQRRHLEHVRRDSDARITSFSMIGDPVLDIAPGSPTRPPIEAGDTLHTRPAGSPAAAIERARSLQATMQELVKESRAISSHARERAEQTARMSRQLMATAHELQEFADAFDQGPVNTIGDPEFMRSVSNINRMMDELGVSFSQAADRARAARADAEPGLRRLAARADTISAQINQLQQAISNRGGGLLVRAQTDSAIVKALHGAQAQMDSLIAETKKNPMRFWF
jgi:phospholipid/cholesterol/gamma-HCH transport system substrate-binding protein